MSHTAILHLLGNASDIPSPMVVFNSYTFVCQSKWINFNSLDLYSCGVSEKKRDGKGALIRIECFRKIYNFPFNIFGDSNNR